MCIAGNKKVLTTMETSVPINTESKIALGSMKANHSVSNTGNRIPGIHDQFQIDDTVM